MPVLYAQTSGNLSTEASSMVPIPGLELTLPRVVGEQALVILNVPDSYITVTNMAGIVAANFAIALDGTRLPNHAQYLFPTSTYSPLVPTIHVPVTLVVSVPLTDKLQKVTALWRCVAVLLQINSPATASLSAMY